MSEFKIKMSAMAHLPNVFNAIKSRLNNYQNEVCNIRGKIKYNDTEMDEVYAALTKISAILNEISNTTGTMSKNIEDIILTYIRTEDQICQNADYVK